MKQFTEKEKQPKAKNGLLQTYFTSLVSLVLCVAMFLGTSYAWFTSDVTNTGNEIYIGILDVELLKQIPDPEHAGQFKDVSLSEMDGTNNKYKLFDSGIRWEPGYTALETVKIVNAGDLAFKYKLDFVVSDGVTLPADVAKYFDVWVYAHKDGAAPTPAYYGDIKAENGWVNAGTLDKLLAGQSVLTGTMEDVRGTGTANAGTVDGIATAHTYTIAMHMNEDAGEAPDTQKALMGKKIELNVKLVAYQLPSEADGFGNSNYDNDEIAYASDLAQLQAALADNKDVILTGDIEAKTDEIVINGGTLDGNGKTVACTKAMKATQPAIKITGGTVKNVDIAADAISLGIGIGIDHTSSDKLSEDLIIDGVTVCANEDIFKRNLLYAIYAETVNSPAVVVTNSALYGAIECPNAGSFTATDSTFGSGEYSFFGVSGNTSFTNCTFESPYCFIADTSAGKTITFTDCNVAGTKLTADNFKTLLVTTAWDYSSDLCSANLKNYTIIIDGVTVTW